MKIDKIQQLLDKQGLLLKKQKDIIEELEKTNKWLEDILR